MKGENSSCYKKAYQWKGENIAEFFEINRMKCYNGYIM